MLGEPRALKVILSQGGQVNALNEAMQTPLFFAVASNNPLSAALLIKHNADLMAKDRNGLTAFDSIKDIEEWVKNRGFNEETREILKSRF